MKNLLSTSLAVVLLALVATGIDRFFKIGTLGDSPVNRIYSDCANK